MPSTLRLMAATDGHLYSSCGENNTDPISTKLTNLRAKDYACILLGVDIWELSADKSL